MSTNLLNLSSRFFLLLFLLPSLLLQHHFTAEADESIDSTCKSANEYLDAMYRCRGSDFQVVSFCTNQSSYELNCNRSIRIAIFNASVGRGADRRCSQTAEAPLLTNSLGPTNAASECCLLPTVENKCHGKTKCNLNVDELLYSTEAGLCAPRTRDGHRPQQRIMIVFICVNQRTFKELKRDSTSPDSFCDGHSQANDDNVPTDGLQRNPVDIVGMEESPTTTAPPTQPHRLPPTETLELTSANTSVLGVEQSESTSVRGGGGDSLDWMWSLIFIKDNMDRFLIYLFLSIAVGVILVLLVVILGLCFGRWWRKQNSTKAIDSGHVTQTSTQTSDVTTSLIASNHTQGIELVHHAHIDSLHTRPVSRSNGNSKLAGNFVHFAPDDSTQGEIRGQGHGNSTYLNAPLYQIDSSNDSVDGGDRVDHEDFRSNSLGRFYTNPYRHDSYRSDGYRTLQHK